MKDSMIARYEKQGTVLLEQANGIEIVNDVTREAATEFRSNVRKAIKGIEGDCKKDIGIADALHKSLVARKKRFLLPFSKALVIINAEIGRNYLEQEAIQREEERKQQVEIEAERVRQEEAAADEIADAIDDGDLELADALSDSEVVVTPVVPVREAVRTTQSAAGSSSIRKDIKVEVADKMVVIAAVANAALPDTLLVVDLGMAKRYAKASGLKTMPGFRITEDVIVSGRTR